MEPSPVIASPTTSPSKDEEHLRLLAIFHYVVAALGALFACFPLVHVAIGLLLFFHRGFSNHGRQDVPPHWFGLIFVIVGGFLCFWGGERPFALLFRAGIWPGVGNDSSVS